MWWIKIWEGYLWSEESQPHTKLPRPGFQCQEEKSPHFLAIKTNGDWIIGRNSWSHRQLLLKNSYTVLDSLHLSSSTVVASWNTQVAYREKLKFLASKWELEDNFLSDRKANRGHCPFSELSPHRATEPASWCHIRDSINMTNTFATPWWSQETPFHPTYGLTHLLFHMNGRSWFTLHNFLNPLKLATANLTEQLALARPQPLYLLLSGCRHTISINQPRFTAWLCLGISKLSTSSSHLRLLYSLGRVTPGKTQAWAKLGLHHQEKPRACTPSGQQLTTSEHHQPAPAQLILHRGWRFVVSGHRQSLQLTSLYKSLPMTCQ